MPFNHKRVVYFSKEQMDKIDEDCKKTGKKFSPFIRECVSSKIDFSFKKDFKYTDDKMEYEILTFLEKRFGWNLSKLKDSI